MRQTALWGLLGLGTLLYIGGLLGPNQRQAAPLIHALAQRGPVSKPLGTLDNFAYPVALVHRGNQLWVVDHNNNRILSVTAAKAKFPALVSLFAGNGQSQSSGDGGLATRAGMFPLGITADDLGNMYVADHYNQRIRKITPQGQISTVAGNGKLGFSGDGGLAIQAQLNDPTGVVVDGRGVMYIADQENNRIRKVENGIISSLTLDQSLKNPWSVALDCEGNLLIVDLGHDQIRRWDGRHLVTLAGIGVTGYGGDGGLATHAQLNSPAGVAVRCQGGEQSLYIADSGNDRIRKVDAQGVITTFAGSGEFGFGGDGGLATAAELASPYAVVCDQQGNLYVADANNNRVRRVNPAGIIETVLSTTEAKF